MHMIESWNNKLVTISLFVDCDRSHAVNRNHNPNLHCNLHRERLDDSNFVEEDHHLGCAPLDQQFIG